MCGECFDIPSQCNAALHLCGIEVMFDCGRRIPVIADACKSGLERMPVTTRWIGDRNVSVLRDTDCSTVVIKRSLVDDDQLTKAEEHISLREKVMKLAHDTVMSGHQGCKKTKDRIWSNFWWSGMGDDVKRYCRSCDICQRTVAKGQVVKVPLGKMPVIDTPFDRVAVDLVGPIFPATEKGYKYILTMVDYATRYPEAQPLKDIRTETVAEALVNMFARVGIPREILSDQGSQFISSVMKEVCRLLSVKQMVTTPYHPMCNGLVEKFNGTLKNMLRKMCAEKPKDWDRYINPLLFAYREVRQESLGYAPFEL